MPEQINNYHKKDQMNRNENLSPGSLQPNQLDYRLKVVMVGNSNVGKSSMVSSYIDNNF